VAAKAGATGIVIFLLIAVGGAWIIWGIAWLLGVLNTGPIGQVAVGIGAFAPALATIVVRRWVTREGFADAGLRLPPRSTWPLVLFAWLSPLVVVGVIALLAAALGLPVQAPSRPDLPPLPILVLSSIVGALIATPILWGEEFGWRGYLQLRLAPGRPVDAAILTGLIWGIFHYPVILLGFEGYEDPRWGLLLFPVFTVLLSIIFGWLRQRTGSVWVTCLAHSATNAIGGSLTALLFLSGDRFLLTSYAGVLGLLPLGAVCLWIVLGKRLASNRESLGGALLAPSN
jgi:membrane protease YdiL (CAAX protease family)